MKYGKINSCIIIFIFASIVAISCSTTPYEYTGQHRLDGETRKLPVVAESPGQYGQGNVVYGNDSDRRTRAATTVKRNYSGPKEMIAVMDFGAKDVPYSVAFSVSELIRTELINTGRYTVIERSQMKEILKEQGFQQTGCTDTSCAVQVGKLLSAKKILVGSVMRLGAKLIISGRVVDVERGVGEQGASGKANSVDELDTGVIEFINRLSDL
jgi:TolB-like protein